MILLLGVLFFLLPISLLCFKRDLFSPSFLFLAGFFMSALFAVYNIDYWGIDLSVETQMCFVVGWISFFLGEIFINMCEKKRNIAKVVISQELSELRVDFIIWLVFLVVNVIISILLYVEVMRIASVGNVITTVVDGVNSLTYGFKKNQAEVAISSHINHLIKVTKGSAFVFLYIFVNNIVAEKKGVFKNFIVNLHLLIVPLLYCYQCYIMGGRFTIIAFLIAAIFIYYFLLQKKNGWKYKVNIKIMLQIMIWVIIVMAVFWLAKGAVGRVDQHGLIDYISYYVGGPYALFDLYIKMPVDRGHETFSYMLSSFNKLGFEFVTAKTHEFRFSCTGVLLGNAYSALRNYYHDFGMVGVSVLSMMLSLIFNSAYIKLKNCKVEKNVFFLLLYSSVIYTIPFQFFTDYFYARFSIGYFIEIFVMYILYLMVFKYKYKLGRKIFQIRSINKNTVEEQI